MSKFLKIVATVIFLLIWGQLQHGCQQGAKSTGSGAGYMLANLIGLILLIAGIYGIWKYNPKSNDADNSNK
jgi:hypothetical protein